MLYRTFTTREKVLFVFFGILLIGAVYYFLVFRPVTDQKIQVQNRIYTLQEEQANLEVRYTEYMRMKNALKELPPSSELKPIPEYDNVRGVMGFLNTTLEKTDDFSISFASVNIEENADFARRTLNISFATPGEESAKEIILELLDAPFRSQASNMNISFNNDGACNVNMTLTFFEIL